VEHQCQCIKEHKDIGGQCTGNKKVIFYVTYYFDLEIEPHFVYPYKPFV